MDIDREFRLAFEESGLEQVKLAGLLGKSPMTVNRWINEGPHHIDVPWYALQFLRVYLMLPLGARQRLPTKVTEKPVKA